MIEPDSELAWAWSLAEARNERICELLKELLVIRAENTALRKALEVLYEEADSFNVSGVYFNEPCMGHKGLELAIAALKAKEDQT